MMMAAAMLGLALQSAPGSDWVNDPAFQTANNAFLDCAERALVAEAASNRGERRAVDRAYGACAAEERALNAEGTRLRGPDLGRRISEVMRLIFRERMTGRLRALRAARAAH